jgi:tetratricopeptide (TPR) repeat protein
MWHYARGVAHAARGDVRAAREQALAIAGIGERTDFTQMTSAGVPAPDIVRLATRVVDGRAAQAERDYDAAAAAFRDAAAIQDGLPYTEPPYWYYPVRQSLLLQAGKPTEAEEMFRAALRQYPNSAWALYGLREAQAARGDTASAAATQATARCCLGGQAPRCHSFDAVGRLAASANAAGRRTPRVPCRLLSVGRDAGRRPALAAVQRFDATIPTG